MNLPVLIAKMNEILIELPSDICLTPTLFVRGEKSNYILEEDYDQLFELFPNSEIETIYNAGHWLHAENPLDFYQQVFSFIV
jgi:pimeloyl-ACP methyl ester carboxylesterase